MPNAWGRSPWRAYKKASHSGPQGRPEHKIGSARPDISCSRNLVKQAQALMLNIGGGVQVPVMDRAAGGAGPCPNLRILDLGIPGPANRTELRGWEEPADRN